MTSNSWTENEEHDIPSQTLKTIFGLHASVIFRPQYVWFPIHLWGPLIPLWYQTLVANRQNWLFISFHQSRSVLSPNPIELCRLENYGRSDLNVRMSVFVRLNISRVCEMLSQIKVPFPVILTIMSIIKRNFSTCCALYRCSKIISGKRTYITACW